MMPANVAFISIMERFHTDTPFGRAMIGILSVFAQLERENIYERTRGGMQKRVEKGYWPGGGRTPYGYDYDPVQGILVRNKVNAGYIVYNGEEYKGLHEPIISMETYTQAMQLLANRSAAKLVTKTDHLLTGFCYCGKCGAKMRYMKWGKAGYKLVCYSQQRSKQYLVRDPNCDTPAPFAEDVEAGVIRTLFTVSEEKLANARKSVQSDSVTEMLQEQLNKAEAKLRRLYGLYGDNGDDLLLDAINETKADVERLKTSLADERSKEQVVLTALSTYQRLRG